eukprot:UN13004
MPLSEFKAVISEVSCCLFPAAVVACSYNYLVAQNKMKTLSIGIAGTFASFIRYGMQGLNNESGICKEDKLEIALTSIVCSSTVAILLDALKDYGNIDNNGVLMSSFCITGGVVGFILSCYENARNTKLRNQLIRYDEYHTISSWLAAIIGASI